MRETQDATHHKTTRTTNQKYLQKITLKWILFLYMLHAAHLVMIYEDANGTGTQDRTKQARPAVAISAACNHCMGAQLKADAIKCNSYIVNWRYSLRFLNRLPLAANSLLIEWIEPPFCPRQCGIRLRCEFYVLFMLCKRGPIIVKISKQIVKIDRCRLSLSFGAPWCWLTHIHTCSHTHRHSNWDSPNAFDGFICGVSNSVLGTSHPETATGDIAATRVNWVSLSLPRLFVYRK